MTLHWYQPTFAPGDTVRFTPPGSPHHREGEVTDISTRYEDGIAVHLCCVRDGGTRHYIREELLTAVVKDYEPPSDAPSTDGLTLYAILQQDPHRMVCRSDTPDKRGNCHRWNVTRGGGTAPNREVQALIAAGMIRPAYSNCPGDLYQIGPTMDLAATIAAKRVDPEAAVVLVEVV